MLPIATAGTYTVKLDPKDIGAGSITLKVWNVPNDVTTSANLNGTPVNVATSPGQNATVSFAAAANQRVQIQTSNNTYPDAIPVTLYEPDGETVVATWDGRLPPRHDASRPRLLAPTT